MFEFTFIPARDIETLRKFKGTVTSKIFDVKKMFLAPI